jgi:hypothetical protein
MSCARGLTAAFLLVIALSPVAARAQEAPSRVLFRVFLTDGRVLSSYGEWARVEDRVVFSMPGKGGAEGQDLHLVSIPADAVDWKRTGEYADSVRAAAYAVSRGDADFAQLSADMAKTLNEVALIADPGVRLATAQRARQTLADWPGSHYGYRVAEVREILGVLDGIIAELRAAVGQTRFDFSLTSSLAAPPAPPLPPPSDAEVVEQLQAAASLVETPAERMSLLQAVLNLLDRAVGTLPEAWAARIRKSVLGDMAAQQRVDRAYEDLRTTALGDAMKAADKGDVKTLERVRARVETEDRKLGSHQPGEVEALLATIDVQLDAARQLRLARDQFESRAPAFRRYRRSMGSVFSSFKAATSHLEAVRSMSGPPVNVLTPAAARLAKGTRALAKVEPPVELTAGHALVQSAWELAENAFRLRLEAVAGNNMAVAQQASSAAAGALMLYARARADLQKAMEPPTRQ